MTTLVLNGCAVATVDAAGTEHASGHVVITDGRIAAVGPGPAPSRPGAERIDAAGLLVTPGLVNSHHHLYQWITRGYATDDTLFGWLSALYPVWARLTPELTHAAAAANLGWLALTGMHDLDGPPLRLPRAGRATCSRPRSSPPARSGCGSIPRVGSMNLGASQGGLPPDSVVEDHDAILAATGRPSTGGTIRPSTRCCVSPSRPARRSR